MIVDEILIVDWRRKVIISNYNVFLVARLFDQKQLSLNKYNTNIIEAATLVSTNGKVKYNEKLR